MFYTECSALSCQETNETKTVSRGMPFYYKVDCHDNSYYDTRIQNRFITKEGDAALPPQGPRYQQGRPG